MARSKSPLELYGVSTLGGPSEDFRRRKLLPITQLERDAKVLVVL